ncbi:MAG: hypothetical protein V4456_16600 [Bacteroidota bacterium]
MNLNEITTREIAALTDVQLSRILLNLLHNEVDKFQFDSVRELVVPLKINIADGGEDGKLDCEGTRGSRYIHSKLSVFQCKATKMGPDQVFKEFFSVYIPARNPGEANRVELKENIKEVLDRGGQYVFFISYPYNNRYKKPKLEAAHRALDEYNALHGTAYSHNQVRIMEGNEIKDWVNEYIDTIIRVQEFNNIHRLLGLQTIEQLAYWPEINQIPFHSNAKLDQHIAAIQATTSSPRASLRIIGHSGLGKTRLVYEAIKLLKSNSAIYYSIVSHPQDIINFVLTYGTYYHGTLIVDNCDYQAHRLLKQHIQRTNSTFKLISIDFNVSEETDPASSYGEEYIFLEKSDYQDIVKKILNDQYEHKLDMGQIDQIADFAEGFPGMAVLFANARLDGRDNLSELLGDDMIYRIAFGRDWDRRDKDKYELLKAFSIFANFFKPARGTEDILSESELQQETAQRNLITQQICDPVRTVLEYRESTDYFERSKVMERRGHYLMVKPTPLAIKLATEWWRYADANKLIAIFPELERTGLAIPLVSRIAELDQLSHAKRIVNQVWGPKSPFGSAEVLNTPLGSRIFRSIAHVNPESAIQTLNQAFGQKAIQTLKSEVGPGRRNIIWALETLVFIPELFEEAATLLFKFAAAENEQIGNNATGQFLHLFHIILPGTGADLKQRLALLDKLMKDFGPEEKHLCVVALCRGLKGDTFRRDIGAESRGSSAPLKDFDPTWAESAGYWDGIIERLSVIAQENPEELEMIKNAFAGAIRNLFYNRMPFLVEKAVLSILKFDGRFWEGAISQINTSIEYEDLNEDDRKVTNRLLENLKPITLENQLKYYVSSPVWNYESRPKEEYVDHTGIAAEQFAERLVTDKADISGLLPQMLTGEQRKSFHFGRKLGQLIQGAFLAQEMLNVLGNLPPEKQNPEIAAAYISALPDHDRLPLFRDILANPKLTQQVFFFARSMILPLGEIMPMFRLIDEGLTPVTYFYQFTYGRGLEGLTDTEIKLLFEKIATYPDGEMVALELTHELIGKDKARWGFFRDFIARLLTNSNLMMKRTSRSNHAWQEMITRLLDEQGEKPFTEILTRQLIEAVNADHISSFDGYLTSVIRRLIIHDFQKFWEIISPSMLNYDYLSLRFFLGSHNGNMGTTGLLDQADIDTLIEWCKESPPLGTLRIARMMPVTPIGDVRSWHPLAMAMINNFGDSAHLLDEISANINSFGSVGSRVPYLKDQQELVKKLLSHPIERVKKWAKNFVKLKEKEIKRSAIEEQGYYLNI